MLLAEPLQRCMNKQGRDGPSKDLDNTVHLYLDLSVSYHTTKILGSSRTIDLSLNFQTVIHENLELPDYWFKVPTDIQFTKNAWRK